MLSGLKWMAPVVSGTTDRSAKGVSAVSSSSSPCKDVTQSLFVKPKYIIHFYYECLECIANPENNKKKQILIKHQTPNLSTVLRYNENLTKYKQWQGSLFIFVNVFD